VRYLDAPNEKIVRKLKTGQIVQVELSTLSDDSNRKSLARGRALTYEETLKEGRDRIVVLKHYVASVRFS
jgi:hypothetical protein